MMKACFKPPRLPSPVPSGRRRSCGEPVGRMSDAPSRCRQGTWCHGGSADRIPHRGRRQRRADPGERRRYRLSELLAQCDLNALVLHEDQDWLDMPDTGDDAAS